ncbi:MAG TPA: AAA family ATPase [Candidatus Dormibacteraeota bacterium]
MTKLAPALDAAITYAAHGLKPFPLAARSKVPTKGSRGFEDATTDGGKLHRMFIGAGDDANVGIATGDGLLVLDVDSDVAEAWLAERAADGDVLPRTWVASSGKGRHIYLRVARPIKSTPLAKVAGFAEDGSRVKGEGGYVVAPPSVHPDGPTYQWTVGPLDCPVAAAPTWLLALLDAPRAAPRRDMSAGAPFPEGGRNSGLTAEAGRLRRRGISQPALEVELLEINRARCQPPLPDDEVLTIARSVGRYPPDPVAVADDALEARVQAKGPVPSSEDKRKVVSSRIVDAAPTEGDELVIVSAADVEARAVRWLWKGHLPAGMLSILDGDPGNGKSSIVADWMARVTTGRDWPDGERCELGGAIYVQAEDPEEEVVIPRLRAAGADIERVKLVRSVNTRRGPREVQIPGDVGLLELAIRAYEARLLVFDPIFSYLDPHVNANSDMEVRQALTPLGKMLARTGCAGVMLRHLKKDNKVSIAMYRGGGSIAIVALARAGFAVHKMKGQEDALVLSPTKANLAKRPRSLGYSLEEVILAPGLETSRVVWGAALDADVDAELTAFGGDRQKPRDLAKEILMEELAEGPKPSKAVEEIAAARGIVLKTFKRARKDLNVIWRQVNGDAYWIALPEHQRELAEVGAVRGPDGRLYTQGVPVPLNLDAEEVSHLPASADISAEGQEEGHISADSSSEGQVGHNFDFSRAREGEDGPAPCPTCGERSRLSRRGRAVCASCGTALAP